MYFRALQGHSGRNLVDPLLQDNVVMQSNFFQYIHHTGERFWTDVEPGEFSISDYEVSKKLIRLLRQQSLPREDDGTIEFWRIKDDLQKYFVRFSSLV